LFTFKKLFSVTFGTYGFSSITVIKEACCYL